MFRNELQQLSSIFSIDIFLYDENGELQLLTNDAKNFNYDFLKKAAKTSFAKEYTLITFENGYVLSIPLPSGEKLIGLKEINELETQNRPLSYINFLSQSANVSKLIYFLYEEENAPERSLALYKMSIKGQMIKQLGPFDDIVGFHMHTYSLLKSLAKLEEEEFQSDLDKLETFSILGQALKSNNVIRGEKDILIDLVSKFTDTVENNGLSIEKSIYLQTEIVQRIEAQQNIFGFNAWLEEIAWTFFRELKRFKRENTLSRADQIEQYLTNHFQENVKISDIADRLSVSKQSINNIFKQKYGPTVKKYLINLKIDEAKRLLTQTNFKIKDIANYLSFTDESYFILTFNRYCNMTPAAFRKLNKAKASENEA